MPDLEMGLHQVSIQRVYIQILIPIRRVLFVLNQNNRKRMTVLRKLWRNASAPIIAIQDSIVVTVSNRHSKSAVLLFLSLHGLIGRLIPGHNQERLDIALIRYMVQTWGNRMNIFGKPWTLGVLLILLGAVAGELLVVFHDYVFYRLGINRNAILLALWALPVLSSYIASYYSKKHKLLMGLSYVVLFPLIGTAAHYINGELGGAVDFAGLSGAAAIFKLYFGIGSILVILGTLLGLVLSKIR
jgi:hypothetical protein